MSDQLLIDGQYIAYLKLKYQLCDQLALEKDTRLEKHRIVPAHQGGTYSSENVIHITFEEHTLAHYYRYLEFRQSGDRVAFTFMRNQTADGRLQLARLAGSIGGKKTNKNRKTQKFFFHDPEW